MVPGGIMLNAWDPQMSGSRNPHEIVSRRVPLFSQ